MQSTMNQLIRIQGESQVNAVFIIYLAPVNLQDDPYPKRLALLSPHSAQARQVPHTLG
jgi:hypothetical protein